VVIEGKVRGSAARREFVRSAVEGLVWGLILITVAITASQVHTKLSLLWDVIFLVGGGLIVAVVYTVLRVKRLIAARLDPAANMLFERSTYGLPGMLYQYRQYPTGRGTVTLTNDAIRHIYELDPETARRDGVQIMRLVHPDDRERIWKSLMNSHTNLAPWREEYRIILPKAGVVWRYADAFVERLPDGGTLWHGYIIDITKEKTRVLAVEEARRRAEAVNLTRKRFLEMLSHDMRLSAKGIIGHAAALSQTELSPSQRESVSAIEGCTNGLLGLIDDMLDLARLREERPERPQQRVSVPELIEGVVQICRPQAADKGLEINVSYGVGAAGGIEVDRVWLWQVLVNLVSNAVKFTKIGGIKILVSCNPAKHSDELAE